MADIELWIRSRADKSKSIEARHAEVMERMAKVAPPLGFAGLTLPPAPDCGDGLGASYGMKFPIRGLRFMGHYIYRGERYIYRDEAKFDDFLRYGFKTSNKAIDYRAVLHEHLPKVVEAYQGYRMDTTFDYHDLWYVRGGDNGYGADGYAIEINEVYNRLRKDKRIDVDGRNNIYTLRPAQYWDAELCRRALGYSPDEVVARLRGKVPRVERLLDGVYLVLNDDPALTYEAFVEMNERVKPVLGLI